MRTLLMWVTVLALAGVGRATAGETPFADVAIGDWARYTLNASLENLSLRGQMVMTAAGKSSARLSLRQDVAIDASNGGRNRESQWAEVDLTREFDPLSLFGNSFPPGFKLDMTETGRETVATADGRMEFDTEFVTYGVAISPMTGSLKIWTSEDLPLRWVKFDLVLEFNANKKVSMQMLLAAFGDASTSDMGNKDADAGTDE